MAIMHHVARGPAEAPAVLLGASLGTDHTMWDPVVDVLAERFRVVAFDWRGHGQTPAVPGPYRVGDLVGDVIALAENVGARTFGYAGLSLGGFVGQALAARHPERVAALVVCCSSPWFGDPAPWHERAARVRAEGTAWLREPLTERWFTPEFVAREPEAVDHLLGLVESVDREGYASCAEAIAGTDLRAELAQITAPTLVISGGLDPVSPPADGEVVAGTVSGARQVILPQASHMTVAMAPGETGALILGFLTDTMG